MQGVLRHGRARAAGLPRALGLVLVAALSAAVLAACGDDRVAPHFEDVVRGDVDPGTEVTVEGSLERTLGDRALLLSSGDMGPLLVVSAPAAGNVVVDEEGQALVVTGDVRRLTTESLREATEGDPPEVDLATAGEWFIEAELVREDIQEDAG